MLWPPRGAFSKCACTQASFPNRLCSCNFFLELPWVRKVNTGQIERHLGLFGGLLPGQANAACPGLSPWTHGLLWLLPKPSVCPNLKTNVAGFRPALKSWVFQWREMIPKLFWCELTLSSPSISTSVCYLPKSGMGSDMGLATYVPRPVSEACGELEQQWHLPWSLPWVWLGGGKQAWPASVRRPTEKLMILLSISISHSLNREHQRFSLSATETLMTQKPTGEKMAYETATLACTKSVMSTSWINEQSSWKHSNQAVPTCTNGRITRLRGPEEQEYITSSYIVSQYFVVSNLDSEWGSPEPLMCWVTAETQIKGGRWHLCGVYCVVDALSYITMALGGVHKNPREAGTVLPSAVTKWHQ